MYKKALGFYWKWRINKNQSLLEYLLEVKEECSQYPNLVIDVQEQIEEVQYLIAQAEIQLLKCAARAA